MNIVTLVKCIVIDLNVRIPRFVCVKVYKALPNHTSMNRIGDEIWDIETHFLITKKKEDKQILVILKTHLKRQNSKV